MATKDVGFHITHGDLELLGDEAAKARRVEDAGHPDHALARKLADLERQLRHGIERVADDDENGIGRSAHQLLGHAADDVLVGFHEVVPGHAGLAGDAGGDHADARAGGLLVAIGSDDVGVVADDRAGLQHVERLSLGQAFYDVDQHDVGVAALSEALGQRGADITGPHHGDLGTSHPPATVANRLRPSFTLRTGMAGFIQAGERRLLRTMHESAARTHLSWRGMLLLSSFWFAIAYVTQPLGGNIIPLLVDRFTDPMTIRLGPLAIAADVNTYVSVLDTVGAAFAIVWQPAIGAISDNTGSA